MATTSLWHIEGRLKDLIDYVENPEKTKAKTPGLQDLYNVFSYVQRPEATQKGEYVTALNCLRETALRQMILTKKRYGKTDGYIAWHGYQSFKPEEVTPQLAHEIGVKLAKEMWGDRFELIVTTHLDKEHIHCHFCFNSVSFRDGGKYNYSKAERKRMVEISDRLCREYGLSVIEKPRKAPSRLVWLDEKDGKPTRYNVYRADVREAIDFSRTPYYMEDYLRRKGYITDFTGKHWKIRLPQYEHFTRLDVLESAWLFRNTPVPDRCMNPNNISEVVYYFLQDKGAEYRGDLLYERAKAEFDARMEELAALPPKEILDHAYEKIIKEDFLCHLEEGLDEWETDALLSYPQPLAALYTEWMGVDYSYLDIDRIQSTAKQAAGKRLNELRHHEFDVNGEPPAELRYFYDLHSEILDNPDLEWVGDMEP